MVCVQIKGMLYLTSVMLNEAKTSRPELRGRGQDYKGKAKNNYENVPNND